MGKKNFKFEKSKQRFKYKAYLELYLGKGQFIGDSFDIKNIK